MVQVHDEKSSVEISFTDTSKLYEDISSLYLSEKFSDVTLIVDGQNIYAHKNILAARSNYFEAFFSQISHVSQQVIELAIPDVSVEAFKSLLKYIYTGIIMSADINLIMQVVRLAHQYSLKNLESELVEVIASNLNLKNVYFILNTANLYDLDVLRDACLSFMDNNALEILSSVCFENMPQQLVIKLLKRDTFYASEIEIFKAVAKWCKNNEDIGNLVIQCVRLTLLSVGDIVSTVRPSRLMDYESLLNAITEIVDAKPKMRQSRGLLVFDQNIATPQHKAEVISGTDTSFLLTGNRGLAKHAYHIIDGKSDIVIKLDAPSYLNHIRMMLWSKVGDRQCSSYYVEVSLDQKKWRKIIDYSGFVCQYDQNLYFDQQIAKYIRIVGTHNTADNMFKLVFFEAYNKSSVPKCFNGVICPHKNVATFDEKAVVIQGGKPEFLLNGDSIHYDVETGYTSHTIGSGNIIIQLPQPYIVSSMKLLLWDGDSRSYRYYIETSVNKDDWEIAVDRRNEDYKSWQNLDFKERVVVFIRITGTHNTVNSTFHCVHFECPSVKNNDTA